MCSTINNMSTESKWRADFETYCIHKSLLLCVSRSKGERKLLIYPLKLRECIKDGRLLNIVDLEYKFKWLTAGNRVRHQHSNFELIFFSTYLNQCHHPTERILKSYNLVTFFLRIFVLKNNVTIWRSFFYLIINWWIYLTAYICSFAVLLHNLRFLKGELE